MKVSLGIWTALTLLCVSEQAAATVVLVQFESTSAATPFSGTFSYNDAGPKYNYGPQPITDPYGSQGYSAGIGLQFDAPGFDFSSGPAGVTTYTDYDQATSTLGFSVGAKGAPDSVSLLIPSFRQVQLPAPPYPGLILPPPHSLPTVAELLGLTGTVSYFDYVPGTDSGNYVSGAFVITSINGVSATPEPVAWLSMVSGLGMAGFVAGRRRKNTGPCKAGVAIA